MEEIVLILFVLGLMVLFFLLGAAIGGVARGLKVTIFGVKESDKFCGDRKSEPKEASIDAAAAALAAGGVAGAVASSDEASTSEVVNVTHDEIAEDTHQEWSEETTANVEQIDSTSEVTRDANEDTAEQQENEDLSVATPLEDQSLEGANLSDVDVTRVESDEITSEMREVRPNAYAVEAKPFSEDTANLRESRPNAYVVDTIPQGEEPAEQEAPPQKEEIPQQEVVAEQTLETVSETTEESSEMREVRPNAYAVEAKPFSEDQAHLRESRPNAYVVDSTPQGEEPSKQEEADEYDLKDMAAAAVSTVAGVAALASSESEDKQSAEDDKSEVQVWDYTQQEVDYSDINFSVEGEDDNLQLIKGIDAEMESALKEIGLRQFNQIATLTEKEVNFLRDKFNFHSTLNEQVWIEQAKILSAGKITNFSQSPTTETAIEPEISETDNVEEVSAQQETDNETSSADGTSLAGLAAAGLAGTVEREVSDHEREPREDREPRGESEPREDREPRGEREPREDREPRGEREPRENKRLFGEKERAERDEEWRNRYQGERKIKTQDSTVAAFSDEEKDPSDVKKNETEQVLTQEQAETRQELGDDAAYVRPVDSDDLSQIKYISTGLEKKLNLLGVYKLSQIVNWDEQAIAQISDQLELRGDKITEENWRGLAQEALDKQQAEGASELQSSTFSASDLVARLAELDKITDLDEHEKTVLSDNGITEILQIANWSGADVKWAADLLGLSSTERAEGWVTAASALISSGQINIPGGEASGGADDLKRIRGIDDEAANTLSNLGVTTYAQIAEWQQTDMDRVNEMLGTSGRVERQYWVVQAKVLKDGGQTDFSKLYDES